MTLLLGCVIEIFGVHATIWLWILVNLSWMVLDVLLIYGILKRKLNYVLSWLIAHMITLLVRFHILKIEV